MQNSVVIITSDYGEEFLEHKGFGHSRTLYQEVLKVIIYFPGLEEAGKRINLLARSIDIFPTALGLLGISPPPNIHGKDLILLADSGRGAGFAYSELEPFLAPQKFIKAFQEEDYKLILNLPSGKIELYQLSQDAKEKNNLAEKYPQKAKKLLEKMMDLEKSFRVVKAKKPPAPASTKKILKSLGYIR